MVAGALVAASATALVVLLAVSMWAASWVSAAGPAFLSASASALMLLAGLTAQLVRDVGGVGA